MFNGLGNYLLMNNCRPEKQHELFIKLKMIYDQFVKKKLN